MTITKNRSSRDIYTELAYLDDACKRNNVVAELVLLGGSGLLVLLESFGDTFRPTRDVDVNLLGTNNFEQFITIARDFNIDIVGGIIEVPPMEDFKEDDKRFLLDNIGFSNIKVYVPTVEMLACCKLFSTRRKDLEDLENSTVLDHCNMDILMSMVEEYKLNLLNPDNPDWNFHDFNRIIQGKGLYCV